MRLEGRDALSDRTNGALRGRAVLRSKQVMQARDVAERRRRPDQARQCLVVWLRRLRVLAGFQTG